MYSIQWIPHSAATSHQPVTRQNMDMIHDTAKSTKNAIDRVAKAGLLKAT